MKHLQLMRWNGRSIRRTVLLSAVCFFQGLNSAQGAPSDDQQTAAENAGFFGQVDSGAVEPSPVRIRPLVPASLSGFVRQQIIYAVDDQDQTLPFSRKEAGVAQFRTTLNLSLQGQAFGSGNYRISGNGFYDAFYHLHAKDDVTAEEYRDQADEAELRDAYVNVEPAPNVWLKFGRQIIAWGESDFTQIVDLVNPRDERDFGLVDLEDARLPVWATRLSFVGKRWGTDFVLAHEFRPNRLGARSSDFDPFIGLRNSIDIRDGDEPDLGFARPDLLWRGFASFPWGDLGLIYGKVHDHNPVFRQVAAGSSAVERTYPQIEAIGLTANFVAGSWLLKTDLAHKDGTRFARKDWGTQLSGASAQLYIEKPFDQLMLGFEYSGIDDVQLSMEWVGSRILDYEEVLLEDRSRSMLTGRFNIDLWHATGSFEAVLARWVRPQSDSLRLAFTYRFNDAVTASIGGIAYRAEDGDALLYPYRRNDRLFMNARYSF